MIAKQEKSTQSFDILTAIGNTPIIRIGNIYAKFEGANPTGSIKDRVAMEMVVAAEREGKLKKRIYRC